MTQEHQDEHRRARDAYCRAFRFAATHAAPAIRDLTAVLKRLRGAERASPDDAITYGEILEERLGVVARLCATEEPRSCPPTDTPPSDASGAPPPRARSSD